MGRASPLLCIGARPFIRARGTHNTLAEQNPINRNLLRRIHFQPCRRYVSGLRRTTDAVRVWSWLW